MRDRSPPLASLVLSGALLIAFTAPAATELNWRPVWLTVELNGVIHPATIVIASDNGRLWAERSAIDTWRIKRRDTLAAREFLGRMYYALDELAGDELADSAQLQWQIDQRRQTLIVTAAPSAFLDHSISYAAKSGPTSTQVTPGAFFNYDITTATMRSEHWESGLFELGVFRSPWIATQTAAAVEVSSGTSLRRLDSALSADFPERRATLTIGDTISHAGQWGRTVRYAGVQWATNFGTRPDLITFPLPALSGQAAVPSTIDVFVNGALLTSRDVPAGPFTITELPAIAGNGQVTARVRDVFGREHVISESFYAAPQLLRSGLAAYAFEAGVPRAAYGLEDHAYGDPFAQASWRYGLTDSTTTELRIETLTTQTTAGASVAQLISHAGVLHGSIAGSHANRSNGGRDGLFVQAGFDFSGRRFNVGGQASMADRYFQQLGRDPPIAAERIEVAAHAGCNLRRFGSLAGAYVQRMNLSGREAAFINANYSRKLGRWAFLTLSVTHDLYSHGRPGMFASITQPLGHGRSVQYAAHSNAHESGFRTELHSSRTDGSGLSYRVAGENASSSQVSGEGQWQGRAGTVAMGIARRDGVTGVRATASGGVGLLGGEVYALRHIEDNFAVVSVPHQAGVPIYLDNRLVGRTDTEGRVAITGLRPHEPNRISIDPVELPLSVGVLDASVDAIPKGRGGILVQMPVQAARSMLIRVVRPDGSPVAAGARLTLNDREYPVAFEGRAFIDQPDGGGVAAHARWENGECEGFVKVDSWHSLANPTDVVCTESRAEHVINGGPQ